MPPVVEYIDGIPRIKRSETFCSILNNTLPGDSIFFDQLLATIDNSIKSSHPKVKTGALSNCHGDWYEWLISLLANNYLIKKQSSYLLLQLPNISQFDVSALYEQKLFEHIIDLRSKIASGSNVSLITSNPDFVIIDTKGINLGGFSSKIIATFYPQTIKEIQDRYQFFINKCSFENIVGYLSVKTSLRPDRRLQISHEGSLMKALYVHLQTREWVIKPKGLKYYAASTKVSPADKRGLKTVATHSITNVQSTPETAVDKVFEVNSNNQAIDMFQHLF